MTQPSRLIRTEVQLLTCTNGDQLDSHRVQEHQFLPRIQRQQIHLASQVSPSTCYDVLVIADCGASGVSDTLGPITFCTNLCDTTDLCDWTMLMEDSYGDGWNGAEVSVLFNGVFAQSFTITSGSSDTAHFQVCSGTEITVVNTQAGFTVRGELHTFKQFRYGKYFHRRITLQWVYKTPCMQTVLR